MIRRAMMMSPGDQPDLLKKSLSSGADGVMWDLEDGVNEEDRPYAREAIVELLESIDERPRAGINVRINPLNDGGTDDLDALTANTDVEPDGIALAKTQTVDSLEAVADILDYKESEMGVFAEIETGKGLVSAPELFGARRVTSAVFGSGDFRADLGAKRTSHMREINYARQKIVASKAAAGIDAVESGRPEITDPEPTRRKATEAVEMGFDGMVATHPALVEIIQEAFTPDEEEIEWARKVLQARDEAEHKGRFRVDYQFIARPTVKSCQRTMEMAKAAGKA